MPSVVDICNRALDALGESNITSLEDGTKPANLCNRNWPMVRDEVLRLHPWNFAVRRATLAPSTTSPDWGFSYQHPCPSDMLRLIEVKDMSTNDYLLESDSDEGRVILADDDTLYIRYIARVEDPQKYDDLFIAAVSARLTAELVEPLTQSNTKKADAWNAFDMAIRNAVSVDAQENPPAELEEDDWVLARF